VTSRIIGYNPERLQHAEFRHFTIQPLDDGEVDEFIERWYDLAMGSDADKVRLKQRLREAIASSKAIQNLADNPLLLTMMAILNRRQELPRDRADLYDQASRVLLYHWDVDHKRLQLPMDAIGRREKQEILRLVAYEMQAGEDGLKGNLISANRLTQILTEYLREQGFSEPREKANGLIHQLRHRNFILCDRGADTYGFVHRTFLEYFCAVEIVNRFEKQRTLSFEQLRDEVFRLHWQDEAWYEVLRLICGFIDPNFSTQVIQFLLDQKVDRLKFLVKEPWGQKRLQAGGFTNLILAADCISEVKNMRSVSDIKLQTMQAIKYEIENRQAPLSWDAASELIERVSKSFDGVLPWLKQQVETNSSSFVQCVAVNAIASNSQELETFTWLEKWAVNGSDWGIRVGAVDAISSHSLCKTPGILELLRDRSQNDSDWGVRRAAIEGLAKHYSDLPDTFDLLSLITVTDPFLRSHCAQDNPRQFSLKALLEKYPNNPKSIELLIDRANHDKDDQLREWAKMKLKELNLM
jgi:hypothetical protein